MTSEESALQLASNRKELLKRLRETVSVLNGRYHKFFQRKHQRFDFDNKRLYGFDGFYLQWSLRPNPDAPESYENQQTSVGNVTLDRACDEHANVSSETNTDASGYDKDGAIPR